MAMYEEDMSSSEQAPHLDLVRPLGSAARAAEIIATSDDAEAIRRAYQILQAASIE